MSAILAIDGGGTRTRAGLYDEQGNLLAEGEGDATNLSRVSAAAVVSIITDLGRALSTKTSRRIGSIVGGISGAGRTGQAQAVATGLAKAFETRDVRVCSDAHMLSLANLDVNHPILVIAGTGSVVITRRPDSSRVVTGGWGPVLGDEGGAYRIALEGIRNADEDEALKQALIDELGVKNLPHLHLWLRFREPSEIARLASVVTQLAEGGNRGARAAVRAQAYWLAALTLHGLKRAGIPGSPAPLNVYITGGVMESRLYVEEFADALGAAERTVVLERLKVVGHHAALALLKAAPDSKFLGTPTALDDGQFTPRSATEDAFEGDSHLDEVHLAQVVDAMSIAEASSHVAVRQARRSIVVAIETASACLRSSGRIIYAGAGTSGRLGVLDASECPPTFGVEEGRVIGLIAGGDAALRHSIEGAEDDTAAGVRDIDAITPRVGRNDIVIGITASGTTPYALAAIDRGKALGAKTGLVACNPVPLDRADIVIALDTGPEVLPGSTRLKAGTATKMVLNQISTGAMAKAGYVFEGRMVGVRPLNKKLRQRCIRIIAELAKEDEKRAEQRLDETGGSIRLAILMARRGFSLDEARRRLDAARGVLRDALETK